MKNAVVIILLLFAQTVLAQIPQPEPNTYVNDYAHVLNSGQVDDLNKQIQTIEKNTGTQMAIILVDKVPDAYTIEDYALLIGRKWHVGTDKNGIVYVADISQHKQRLQIATGLYQTLTKDKRDAILNQVKPFFKQQDYTGGLKALIGGISDALGADFGTAPATDASTAQTNQASAPQNDQLGEDFWIGLAAIIVIVSLIIAFVIRRRARIRRMQIQAQMYNQGFYDGPGYPGQGPGIGDFVAGAAAGYMAERLMEDAQNGNNPANQNNVPNNNQPPQNTSSDFGNWGGGNSFDDSSSDDSGFSSDSSDSDSGSSSDW